MALHLKRHIGNHPIGILKHILITLHIGELRQFSFSHNQYICVQRYEIK